MKLATQSPAEIRDPVASLSDVALRPSIATATEAVREILGFEVAYVTEMTPTEQHIRLVEGDGESFGISPETVVPVEATYCQRILLGELPNLLPDVQADPRTASMPVTDAAGVGAFASVPLHFSDGRLFGTLCAGSHGPQPDVGDREIQFMHVFARIVADQLERETLSEEALSLEIRAAAARTLVVAVGARDSYTEDHSLHVVERATAVADQLDLSDERKSDVELVALLHDIGKIAVPDAILQKQGKLTEEEWVVMREHPVEGERLILRTPSLEHLAPMIRAEHERWDGGGYPDGLAGEEIPLASRITLTCDAYDAMTTDRPYRAAMSDEEARAELVANAGSQFDPRVVEALLAVVGPQANRQDPHDQ